MQNKQYKELLICGITEKNVVSFEDELRLDKELFGLGYKDQQCPPVLI